MRPANIITAIADIWAGVAIVGGIQISYSGFSTASMPALVWLTWATVGLYGGGVVFNDVFDYELDKRERPERPLPKGQASLIGAIVVGLLLLIVGILAAFQVSQVSGLIAIAVAILALLYDAFAKHSVRLGPLIMGSCRGGNLLLGMSIIPAQLSALWFLGAVPLLYIGSITLISQGEVHGGNRLVLLLGIIGYALTASLIAVAGLFFSFQYFAFLPLIGLWAYFVFPPLLEAYRTLLAKDIFKAVKGGVIALIVLDASLAAGFAGIGAGLIVLALLPISRRLAKVFAVT